MKINKALLFKIMLSGIIILPAFVGATAQRNHSKTNEQQEMLKMIEQLDQLDKMDFEDAIYKAKTCIINRDFQCTEKQFMKAKKYAHGSGDQRILLSARQGLIAEQKLVKEEKVEEKRRYRAEQRRRREARERRKEEKERKKERRKAEKRRQQEREYARRQSEDEQSRQQMYATFMNGLDDIENMSVMV